MISSLVISPAEFQHCLENLRDRNQTLRNAGICLIDLRSQEAYQAGHLPGAVHGNAALLNRSDPPVGGLLPEPEAVNHFLQTTGVNPGDRIVAYDGGLETPAARLIWVMHAYGCETVSWLNGGFKAWQAAGMPVTEEPFVAHKGTLTLELKGENLVSVDSLVTELSNPALKILDVRSAGEYQGTDVRATMAGHVPGAAHLEWTRMLDEHGRLLDDGKLEALLQDLGADHEDPVVVYCQSHQRSAVTYVAMKHLGYRNVRAINGAWSAWGNRQDTPKER